MPSEIPSTADPLLAALQDIPVSHLSDNLDRLSGIVGLQRFHAGRKLVGRALTVKVRPGDNLLIYKALQGGRPGDVLVVDGGGETRNALVGELIMLYAQQRGFAGFVIDGAIRDSAAFHAADFPCYALAANHRGPYKQGPGAIGVPVSVGGQVVHQGDYVVGDEDGVVTFAEDGAAALVEAALATAERERAIQEEIATGRVAQSWLDKVLQPAGL